MLPKNTHLGQVLNELMTVSNFARVHHVGGGNFVVAEFDVLLYRHVE
jgi:hypothetical protein